MQMKENLKSEVEKKRPSFRQKMKNTFRMVEASFRNFIPKGVEADPVGVTWTNVVTNP